MVEPYFMRREFFLLVFFLQSFCGFSQIRFIQVEGNRQKKLAQLTEFLISRPAISWSGDSAIVQTEKEKICDIIMNTFFSKTQGSVQAITCKALNNIDKILDYIPADSIFVMNEDYIKQYEKEGSIDTNELDDRFVGGFSINSYYYPVLEIKFDQSDKLVFIVPIIYFDKGKSEIIEAFLDRQKRVRGLL